MFIINQNFNYYDVFIKEFQGERIYLQVREV